MSNMPDLIEILACSSILRKALESSESVEQNQSAKSPFTKLFLPFIQSRCTLTRQFSPKVTHKGGDKEKITAIHCLWMVDNERGGGGGGNGSENIKRKL